ncbi:MAG TPA: U32 family peptidase, partial [Deltaproteobacteria bacterium]|nr:U32 family peptidase [Deltaproteobacteria bacterium]
MTSIELLSPARDLECGIAAIDHGADAVYIGGPSFGARVSACNPMGDIEKLARHAHRYRARVYLALNTTLFDDELATAEATARRAWDAGVDALIVQDMALLELDLPPLPLIASTQMHNMDVSHIRFLERVGFQRVILARELSLELIRGIRRETSIELEAFVHGSLCVSHSGRCYLSAALGGRSANRGACGQPCRLRWNLIDADGRVLERGRHLLSLKDMDRSAHLSDLIDAGVTSFKIEGRLKDAAYVKNITAYYRTCIDSVLESRSDLRRSSGGKTEILFSPDPRRTFSRGSTCFFLHDKDDGVWSPDTSKSLGEEIGIVRQCGTNWFTLDSDAAGINAGDGLCFFNRSRELQGMQVVTADGARVRVHQPVDGLTPGMAVFRNHDHLFLRGLSGRTSRRKCGLSLVFREAPEGFVLEGRDEDG